MRTVSITRIWRHIKRSKNPPEFPDIDSRVSSAEMHRFDSDMNFRQYYKTERPERYELLNELSLVKSEMDFQKLFRRY